MTLLVTVVMGLVTGAVLSLANLMGHPALFAGVLAILMGGFAAVMLRFAAVVPVVLTFLVFRLALSVLPVPEMFPVMVRRRRRFTVARRRRRFPVIVWRRRRPRLCAGLHGGQQPHN
jgi:hypothetical protein